MDDQVLKGQQWVNRTYSGVTGYVACAEDGISGFGTIYSFIRGLQHELGISPLSDNFGTTTMSRMSAHGPISRSTTNFNMKKLVEAAMYCKGYSGGGIDGAFGTSTQAGLVAWKNDMGFAASGNENAVSAKEMKALLTMDAYVRIAGGDFEVRDCQQWLNATYTSRQDFYIIPCDGIFSRNVQRGLILAIQYSIGMADGVANGTFGPGTRDGLRTKGQLTVGSFDSGTTRFVRLYKSALIFNGQPGVDWQSTTFTEDTAYVTRGFQAFVELATTGGADYPTWCSLLVSTGDPERPGRAADCATPLNAERAAALRSAGYETVGRYINGGAKLMTPAEVQIIFTAGLNFFPIYQEFNNALQYFTEAQGTSQGQKAHDCGLTLGLPTGTIIYFAVDYDATGDEIRSVIVPFFNRINDAMEAKGNKYSVGVYGSRNVCTRVSESGSAVSSFVSGMSTGFSGNLGFPLPRNWAFDQIKTLTVGSGTSGQIEIDKNIKSGRNMGVSSLTQPADQNSPFFAWVRWIESNATQYLQDYPERTSQGQRTLVAGYMRTFIDNRYDTVSFSEISGPVDREFNDYCRTRKVRPTPGVLRDPRNGFLCDIQHLGATLGAYFVQTAHTDRSEVSLADFGGWAGDLITVAAEAYNSPEPASAAYAFAYSRIGNNRGEGTFASTDMLADVDAVTVGQAVVSQAVTTLSEALVQRYVSPSAALAKYNEFVATRFGDSTTFRSACLKVFTQDFDFKYDGARTALWYSRTGTGYGYAYMQNAQLFADVARGMADAYRDKFTT
jgi:peptidoglycan hydrolase-like protein with peptidoglycan-binding domain